MADDANNKSLPVPYISWKTFTAFISSVHGKVPAQIDSSILKSMSGTARSQLLSALKFLKLIDADGTTQDSLKKLADAFNGEQWKPALAIFLRHSYSKVVGDLNLETATPAMLRQRFQNNGSIEGGTIDMALRFYLSALKEADVKFSDHLVVRQRAPKGSGTRKRGSAPKVNDADDDAEIEIPEGTFEIPFSVLGIAGHAIVPDDLTPDQWDAISNYVKMVLGYRLQAQKPKASA
jgi:hypothetical protein